MVEDLSPFDIDIVKDKPGSTEHGEAIEHERSIIIRRQAAQSFNHAGLSEDLRCCRQDQFFGDNVAGVRRQILQDNWLGTTEATDRDASCLTCKSIHPEIRTVAHLATYYIYVGRVVRHIEGSLVVCMQKRPPSSMSEMRLKARCTS